jgi:ATP-dependent Lhr-like helicase
MAPDLVAGGDRFDNRALGLADGATSGGLRSALRAITDRDGGTLEAMMPEVDEDALRQLKFAELLPPDLARQTLAARITDTTATARVIEQPIAVVNHTATTEV